MNTPLLTTKLRIPPGRPELVLRRRLLDQLHAGLHRKLTLISAPAGFGKTTLASTWVSELLAGRRGGHRAHPAGADAEERVDVGWLSLDGADNDPVRFLTYLVAALKTFDPEIGTEALDLLRAAQPSIEAVVALVVNEIDSRQQPVVVVLDDYQVITEIAVHHAVEFLLEHQPAAMHLVITTRLDPALPLSRLRARGQLVEIRQHDLQFTSAESARFLNEAMGLQLSAGQVEALEESTEGWIAGLQLAALSIRGRDDEERKRFIAGFSGRHRFILDYLTDEVLKRQPEDIQRFLLGTSILERMSGPLCDAVLEFEGLPPGNEYLEQLEASNLFTVPLDDERVWYRYHPLFGELLRARLRETQPEYIPMLHRRAAAWYQATGLRPDAVHHALASKDYVLAAEMIERAITDVQTWSRADVGLVLGWLKALPDEAVQPRPWLRLFHSRTLYVSGEPKLATQALAELDDWLQVHPSTPEAARLSTLVATDWASYAAVLGDVQQAKDLARRALSSVSPEDPVARFRAPAILGMAHLRAGEVPEAYHAFSEAADVALAADLSFAAVPFLCNMTETLILQGQLLRALQVCEQARKLGAASGQEIFAGGYVGLELGKIRYEWNELEAAAEHVRTGQELLSRGGISGAFGSVYGVQALVLQALGDLEAARAAAHRAVQIATQGNIPRLISEALAYQARIFLAQGDIDEAIAWSRDYQQVGRTEYLREVEDLTLAHVLLADGRPERAIALLHPMLSSATSAGRFGRVVEIQALRAMALRFLEEPDAALDALKQALALGEREGYLRTFLNIGEPMVALLKRAGSQGIAPHYVRQLVAAFSPLEGEPPVQARQPLVEPLTEREMEVLQLLSEGLSNQEIGHHLFISLPTVKSHTSAIYGKLGVHGREEAVARARALGILPSP